MSNELKMKIASQIVGTTALLTVSAAALYGCMVGPDYVRPATPVPEAYKEIAGWKVAQPGDEGPRGSWWEAFNDPDLNALEAQVDISNQTIQAAAAAMREARAATQAARAALFPVVTGDAAFVRSSRAPGTNGNGAGAGSSNVSGVSNSYNVALDASWEIDLWGGIRRSVEASDTTAQATAADLANAKLSAQAMLADDYLLLRVQDATIDLLRDTVAAYQRSLTLTSNQYRAGVAGRGDVAQAETQLKSTQAQVFDAQVTRAQLEHAIAVLIGKPPADLTIAPKTLVAVFPQTPVALPSTLLERRPDIAGAERRAASANAQIGVAQAAFFPALTLAATGGFQNSVIGSLLSLPSRYWSLGPALAQSVFDAGLRSAQKAEAVATYDQNVATYRSTVLSAFQDVEDNLAALDLLAKEGAVQDDAVKTAREAVTIVLNQYKAGTANYLAVVVLQAAELSNERTALSILGRRLTASVGLIKAVGGGWDQASLVEAKQ
jgi:NodT family efflux transporter outer membrane factor (OMF) lipoprotein